MMVSELGDEPGYDDIDMTFANNFYHRLFDSGISFVLGEKVYVVWNKRHKLPSVLVYEKVDIDFVCVDSV